MKKYINCTLLCATLIAFPAAVSRGDSTDTMPPRIEAQRVTVTAVVEAVDATKREITLKNPMGESVTFSVNPQVKRLSEFQVGDVVRADYFVSVVAELRKPTKAEAKYPLVITDSDIKAPADLPPAVAGARKFKVVTTIEALDRRNQTVTVKGPMGRYLTARVADPTRLTKVRIGDNVILTFTEAIALSLEKVDKKSTE